MLTAPPASPGLKRLFICFLLFAAMIWGCGKKHGNTGDKTDPRQQALLYLSQNHFDEAEASFKKAIDLSPDDASNYEGLARLYLLQQHYKEAEQEANGGLKIAPDNADLHLILAQAFIQSGDKQAATGELNAILKKDPKNIKAYYLLSGLAPAGQEQAWKKNYLTRVAELSPANIVVRLELAGLLAANNQADSARYNLEKIQKMAPDFSDAARIAYQKALSLLQGNEAVKAVPYLNQFHLQMKLLPAYAAANDEVTIPSLLAGHVAFTISPDDAPAYDTTGKGLLGVLTFTDASDVAGLTAGRGLNATASVLARSDRDGVGNLYVYASFLPAGSSTYKHFLLLSKTGPFQPCNVIGDIDHSGADLDAAFADYDNDGYPDLFIATTQNILIYKNQGDGSFSKVTGKTGLEDAKNINKLLFADLDQDGDLDLLGATNGDNKFYRNNSDGTFTEQAAVMGLSGDGKGTASMDFGDQDNDGDLDIAALKKSGGVQLLNNDRHSKFSDISSAAGFGDPSVTGTAIAFGDYNNDGMLDIVVAGGADKKCVLYKNTGHGFVVDPVSSRLSEGLKGLAVKDIGFFDFDNDGHLDLLFGGTGSDKANSGLRLFHNDTTKGFSDVSQLLPKKVGAVQHIKIGDFDMDGDEDILISGPAGIQMLRNDGGSMNHYLQVQLIGLSYGNSKNNRLGIGAQVELKAGDLYQLKTVTGPITEFGVGTRNKLEAVRIIWPNGVPQTIVDPSREQKILEVEQLKGSCPFLFTWNGQKYEFVKDMLWRSALGMPLAVHGRDTIYSFSDASKEYLLVPGEKLKPKDGRYSIKITEELWEAVYFDKAGLVAVDHPDSVSVFADERFVPPPFPGKNVYQVAAKNLPLSAVDDKGNDLLPAISKYDFQYASSFSPGKFQGLATDHDLILDLGDKAKTDSIRLFMRGWIFPTDASINTAMSQSPQYATHMPSLQVINKKGEWETVIPNLGFPMGRDKMVIADLSGKFLTANDRRVRIRTNMQIYWDHIFFSTANPRSPVKMQDLTMTNASLAFRGYSASYRKGGPFGPEWFDHEHTTQGQKWRDLTGNYTRYGDVLPLLQKGDDQYIICDGGDEISIDFDATKLAPLPKGWKRDFLIYSEGWVKDGDLNTANGQTVAPLPFHAMPSYPYGKGVAYPADKEHQDYQRKYNTRKVTTFDFKNALRTASANAATK